MKLIKISMELGIDEDENFYLPGEELVQASYPGLFTPQYDRDKIANYLNNKLYMDPEFFGEFGPENIDSITELD